MLRIRGSLSRDEDAETAWQSGHGKRGGQLMAQISPDMPIGELIVASGLAKNEHIENALKNSATSGLPIGLELVLMDKLDFDGVANAVIAQSLVRDKLLTLAQAVDSLSLSVKKGITLKIALDVMAVDLKSEFKNRLGSLLLDGEFISRKIHKECSILSKSTGLPMGRVMLASGALRTDILDKALKIQKQIREGQIDRQEAFDEISSVKSFLDSVSSVASTAKVKDIAILDLLKDANLLDEAEAAAVAEKTKSESVSVEEALTSMSLMSLHDVRSAELVLQMIKDKQMAYRAAVQLLQRIQTSLDGLPKTNGRTEILTFSQFLRLTKLRVRKISAALDRSVASLLSDDLEMEDSWQYLPAITDRAREVSKAIPNDVIECMERNGFLTPEEKMDVATAARQYKLFRQNELSVDQALVSYHLAKKEKEAFAVWSGTFPSLAIWLPRGE